MQKRTSSRFPERLKGRSLGSVVAVLLLVGLATVAAQGRTDHEDPDDYVWDSSKVVPIVLNGTSISVSDSRVTVTGSTATITSHGTYSISGPLTDGQIIVASTDKKTVRLLLAGADIRCSSSAPILVENAKKTVIVLAENTANYVADGRSAAASDANGPNAVIYSKDDLSLWGAGSLTVKANVYDGISSKNGLIIAGGTIDLNAVDDGLRGKDYLIVRGGSLTVNSGGDGLKSDNEDDPNLGYVAIESGVLKVNSGTDAIQAQTEVAIAGGDLTLISGGGHGNAWLKATTSAKGIKAVTNVMIDGGTLDIDAADDALHSDGTITINGGTLVLASGDDGIHAKNDLTFNGGDIRITKSYEGLESFIGNIIVNDGRIHVVSTDDGINVSAGGDAGMPGPGGQPGGGQPIPGGGGGQRRDGSIQAAAATTYCLYVHGGYLYVDALGDGIDSNGTMEMTGGVVIVNGPTGDMNGALDHSGFTMTGGYLLAVGSAGMAQTTSTTSTQNGILLTFNSALAAGTLVHLQSSQGIDILDFVPTKQYRSVAFSSPALVRGAAYDVYCGGSAAGTTNDGLYQEGTYTPGTRYGTFTVSSVVTTIGGLSATPPAVRR